jgi:hypothetical protein
MEHQQWHTLEETLGIGAISTVSSGSDTGANNCLAGKLDKAQRHGTTEKAVENVIGRLISPSSADEKAILEQKGLVIIAGHGYAGAFETGSGQNGDYDDKWDVNTWNQYAWEDDFMKMKGKQFKILRILSCDTGAEQDGADLLYEMAKIVGKPVAARTGLTSCGSNGITFQDGTTWQVATPEKKPDPIQSPKIAIMNESAKWKIYLKGSVEEITYDDIESIEIVRYSRGREQVSQRVFKTSDHIKMIGNLIFGGIVGGVGAPLGKLTAELRIHFSSEGMEPVENFKNFLVFNNKYLYDAESDLTYLAASPFANLMQFT